MGPFRDLALPPVDAGGERSLELCFKASSCRPLLAPGGQVDGRGRLTFAAVQQNLLIFKLKGRPSPALVVCLEGRKGLSPLVARQGWQGQRSWPCLNPTSLLLTSLVCADATVLPAGPPPAWRNPSWGVHGS